METFLEVGETNPEVIESFLFQVLKTRDAPIVSSLMNAHRAQKSIPNEALAQALFLCIQNALL